MFGHRANAGATHDSSCQASHGGKIHHVGSLLGICGQATRAPNPVRLTCRVLGISPQSFYKWQTSPVSNRDLDDAHLTNVLVDAHADDPEFEYWFLADELAAAGHRAGDRRVWRLCRDQRLWSTTTRNGRNCKRPGPAVHGDLVNREFSADRPNAVWLTDIIEHPTSPSEIPWVSGRRVRSRSR